MQNESPDEIPWDVFDVDIVIDSTGRFQTIRDMQAHLDNGTKRVLLATLPAEQIDRLIIPGINESEADTDDRMLSGGSATTTAMALMLKILDEALGVEYASMTTVHAYTSDQPVQDYAGRDCRRSRSAAENIIPNSNESPRWVEQILPQFQDRLSGYALNVPVQKGSMLDLNVVIKNSDHGVEEVNNAMLEAAVKFPTLIEVTRDPIVSSDVIGNRHSLLFDFLGTMKAGNTIVKTLAWYESLGHACRLLDIVRLYQTIDSKGGDQ
jgi:glyceraldehyde 3-phosphate dehydrogenase